MVIHQLCTIPMGKNLIASDHDNNQSSIYIYSSTVCEYSIANQYYILANTSTLVGGYAIINTADSTPLLSLTFNDSPTHYKPIVCNEWVHHIHHDPILESNASSSISSLVIQNEHLNDDSLSSTLSGLSPLRSRDINESTTSSTSSYTNLFPTYDYDPILSSLIITNIDFIHSIHNSLTSTT